MMRMIQVFNFFFEGLNEFLNVGTVSSLKLDSDYRKFYKT